MDLSVGGNHTAPPHEFIRGKKNIHLHSNTHYCFCPAIQVVFLFIPPKFGTGRALGSEKGNMKERGTPCYYSHHRTSYFIPSYLPKRPPVWVRSP